VTSAVNSSDIYPPTEEFCVSCGDRGAIYLGPFCATCAGGNEAQATQNPKPTTPNQDLAGVLISVGIVVTVGTFFSIVEWSDWVEGAIAAPVAGIGVALVALIGYTICLAWARLLDRLRRDVNTPGIGK
jgi:hypothetical protein